MPVEAFNNEATALRFTVTTADTVPAPRDLSGFDLRLQLRRSAPMLYVAIDLWSETDDFDRDDEENGVVVAVISAPEAARLSGEYEADFVVTPPDGEPIRVWGDTINFTQGVTR